MREIKTTRDYANEIHKLLLEKHETDVPVSKINHIITIFCRRLLEAVQRNRIVRLKEMVFFRWFGRY